MNSTTKHKLFITTVFASFLFSIGLYYNLFLNKNSDLRKSVSKFNTTNKKTIIIQPMGNFDSKLSKKTLLELKKIYPNFILKPNIELPKYAFYSPKNRYRADKILTHLKSLYGFDTVVIGMLDKDISTTKGKIYDWGIMGLGHRPGNACVVSTYRLDKKNLSNQFYKLCIHELGHTQGLPHCPDKSCYMRDAEGNNPIDEESGFCPKCKKHMQEKGWK